MKFIRRQNSLDFKRSGVKFPCILVLANYVSFVVFVSYCQFCSQFFSVLLKIVKIISTFIYNKN